MADLTLTMEVTTESRRESLDEILKKPYVKEETETFNIVIEETTAKFVSGDPLKVEEDSKFLPLNQILEFVEPLPNENSENTMLVAKIKQEDCDYESEVPDNFLIPIEPELELGIHPCPSCSKTFKHLGHLHRHLKNSHNIRAPSKGDKKNRKNKSLAELKSIKKAGKHKLKSPKKKSLLKSIKQKVKPLKKKIKVEEPESGDEMDEIDSKELACDLCGHQCTDAAQLERHKRSHSLEKPYSCDRCSYSCKLKSALEEHKKIHGIRDFVCLKCGVSFDSDRKLQRHSVVHKKNHKGLLCEICNFSAIDKSDLRKHKSEHHSKENTLTCEICGYQTNRPSSFRTHKQTHERHLSFSCGVCKYTCLTLANMKKHVYIHTDEKPFKCHMCDKTFKLMDALKRHVKTVHFRPDDSAAPLDWSNSDHE